jgi:hypothetical protein
MIGLAQSLVARKSGEHFGGERERKPDCNAYADSDAAHPNLEMKKIVGEISDYAC